MWNLEVRNELILGQLQYQFNLLLNYDTND